MACSISASENQCYPGTTVLVNKLGVKEQATLNQAESVAVALRATELLEAAYSAPFSFSFYCGLHKTLFGDIYDWAGELRTVDLSKKGTTFYPASRLLTLGNAKFQHLQDQQDFCALDGSDYIHAIAAFYHELNMLHPFREGNGRTPRVFFTMLLRRKGYNIDVSICDTDRLMIATIYAAQGVLEHLEMFFADFLKGADPL